MTTFYLGYNSPEDENLTLYRTKEEAEYNAEEWVAVEAETIQEAIDKYDRAFQEWQDNNPISFYPVCKCSNELQFSNCNYKCERNRFNI